MEATFNGVNIVEPNEKHPLSGLRCAVICLRDNPHMGFDCVVRLTDSPQAIADALGWPLDELSMLFVDGFDGICIEAHTDELTPDE